MKKSIGLAALCALISPSIAMAQDSASVDVTASFEQLPPEVSLFPAVNMRFGTLLVPRSNGTNLAQCQVDLFVNTESAGTNTTEAAVSTDDPEGALEQDCQLVDEFDYSFATFLLSCAPTINYSLSVNYSSQDPSLAFVTSYDGEAGLNILTAADAVGGVVTESFSGRSYNSTCPTLKPFSYININAGGSLYVSISELEDRYFNNGLSAENLVVGTITATVDY